MAVVYRVTIERRAGGGSDSCDDGAVCVNRTSLLITVKKRAHLPTIFDKNC